MKKVFISIIFLVLIIFLFLIILLNNKKIDQSGNKIGSDSASVQIVQYGDLRCPHCKSFHNEIFPEIKKDYIAKGKVSFEYRDIGILGYESYKLGKLSYIINKHSPSEYWSYIDNALNETANPNKLIDKLDVSKNTKSKIKKDYKEHDNYADKKMEKNLETAHNKSIEVVPSVTINGEKIENIKKYKAVKNIINEEIESSKK